MLPPDTVDTVMLFDESTEGYEFAILFHEHAAAIAADIPPPENAIPTDICLDCMCFVIIQHQGNG